MAVNLPRRKFLQYLASSATCLAFISPATVLAIPNKNKGDAGDLLSFTGQKGLGPRIDTQFIDRKYVALHVECELPSQMIDAVNRDNVEQLFRKMVANEGLAWDEDDRIVWTYQYYGLCDHSVQCYKLLGYSNSTQYFLYNTVQGLVEVEAEWNVLTQDFDYSSKSRKQFNGFVGRYTYLVNRVGLISAEGKMKDFSLVSATPVDRAINYITSRGNVLRSSLMYIIPGITSLVSPFSELLHISTHAPFRRLTQQLGKKYGKEQAEFTSHMFAETVTESAAILMAQKYLKKYHLRDRLAIIDAHAKYLGRRYLFMPDMLAYMEYHGVQETLNSFSDDPLHLVNGISGSSEGN